MNAIAKYASPLVTTLPLKYQGKTRDTHVAQWPDRNDKFRPPLLIVATDRISTHDVVHQSTIQKKGEVLTALNVFFLTTVLEREALPHHLIACGSKIYDYLPGEKSDYPKNLHHRAIVVQQLDMINVEFIYRAYLAGSFWHKYYSQKKRNPYGIELPEGLPYMTRFDTMGMGPLFTPTEKSDTDPPLWSELVEKEYPEAVAMGREVYAAGRRMLHSVGMESVDTKFELGRNFAGDLMIADEALTPDSSRFTPLKEVEVGKEPRWLDKQIARDEAEKMWGGNPRTPLIFPQPVIDQVSKTYQDLTYHITGSWLSTFQRVRLD